MDWINRLLARALPSRQALVPPGTDPETEIQVCIREHALPALQSVERQLASEGFKTSLTHDGDWAELNVINFNGLPLKYAVRGHVYKQAITHVGAMSEEETLSRFARIAIESGGKVREYPPERCHRDAFEQGIMAYYRRFLMKSPER